MRYLTIFAIIALIIPSVAFAAVPNPGQHWIGADGSTCTVWREGMDKTNFASTYCQGEWDTDERLYQLEKIVKEQQERIDILSQAQNSAPAKSIAFIEQPKQTMSPEMFELFAAFEARLAKLEKLVNVIINAISSIPQIKSRLTTK